MDKYQLNLLNKIVDNLAVSSNDDKISATVKITDKGIEVTQNENYHITEYFLRFKLNIIKNIKYYINKESFVAEKKEGNYIYIPLDFANKTTMVDIEFADELVDSGEFEIIYFEADKNAYDVKFDFETKKRRIHELSCYLDCTIYSSISTVAFKPCCDEYSYTVVKWYCKYSVREDYGIDIYRTVDTFLEEVKITDKFYANFNSAFNVYCIITQYDKSGKELAIKTVNPERQKYH